MTAGNSIDQAFSTLRSIGEVSSLNAKQELLIAGKDNIVLKTLLRCAYNPYIQYNIRKLPSKIEDCVGEGNSGERLEWFMSMLVLLHKREISGNAAIDAVREFLVACSPEEYTWYSRVLTRDLKIGLADKGINKVFTKLIPSYDVMLADKVPPADLNLDTPKALKLLPSRIVTQYKIDGYRLNIHVTYDGDVNIRTRNGKVVYGYSDLEREAAEKLPRGYVYDGEIVAPELFEWIAGNMKSQIATAANRDLFSEVMSHAFSKESDKKGIFNMFDMVPLDQWKSQDTTETYEQRLNRIAQLIEPLELSCIVVVPTSRVYHKDNPDDLKAIVDEFHQFLSVGWEGLMIKNLDSPYEFKRTKNLLKMKLMDTVDLTVIDVFEGTGKYEGMMGGVHCDYKGYPLGVGSGWSDDQRQQFWADPNSIVGHTIEVAYQAETSNKQGGLSLSFPVVKSIRIDK